MMGLRGDVRPQMLLAHISLVAVRPSGSAREVRAGTLVAQEPNASRKLLPCVARSTGLARWTVAQPRIVNYT
jgi:hypothetical protein